MAPTAPPRFDARVESPEELAEHLPAPASDGDPDPAPPAGDVEVVGRVERRADGRPGWNTASLLDALVEMHNPTVENP
jgi:hypothetical protein